MDRRSSLGVRLLVRYRLGRPDGYARAILDWPSGAGSMYVLIVSARIKPEQRGRFLEAIEDSAVSSVRDEPG